MCCRKLKQNYCGVVVNVLQKVETELLWYCCECVAEHWSYSGVVVNVLQKVETELLWCCCECVAES